MPDGTVLELESRRRIFEHVVANPGSYLREIQRDLGLSMGSLEYHLGRLAEARLVAVVEGEQKRFFPTAVPPLERRYVALLRQASCRHVVLVLLERGFATAPEMQRATGLPRGTVTYYLAKLEAAGLASAAHESRPAVWGLMDPHLVLAVLVRYRPTFMDRVLDRALEAMDAFALDKPPS